MSIQITHWLRAFLALQESAFDGRGASALLDRDEVVERWPNTTGDDAIAIAAVIDPIVQSRPDDRPARFWRPLAADLARFAITDGSGAYQENRSFWQALLVTCAELHAAKRELPSAVQLDALRAQLLAPPDTQHRNAGSPPPTGPFRVFESVKTFADLYLAEFVYLRDLRGADEREPDVGTAEGSRTIPRTTHGDVVALADFWDKQFRATSDPASIAGSRARVETMWSAALVDVERVRVADPLTVYAKNNAFWRALREVALYTSKVASAPSNWDLAKEAIVESITHLPQNLEAGAGAVAKALGGVAHEVGKVANEAGKGLFSGFGAPALIGAGLLGLFLVTRSRGTGAKAAV